MENIINLVMTLFNIVWLHFFKKQRCSSVTRKSSSLTLIELFNFNIFHVRNPRCPRVDLTLPGLFWVYIHLYTAFWIKKKQQHKNTLWIKKLIDKDKSSTRKKRFSKLLWHDCLLGCSASNAWASQSMPRAVFIAVCSIFASQDHTLPGNKLTFPS